LFGAREGKSSLEGTIDHITFRSSESDFVILKIRTTSGEQIAAKGRLGLAEVGEEVKLAGRWANDPRYGAQFEFAKAEVASPTSREGLERYLSSSLIEGVGPATARRLLDHFGEGFLGIAEAQPERLLEVTGIGPKRQQQIVVSLNRHHASRAATVALYGLGLTRRQCADVVQRYQDSAERIVRRDPYRLAREVRGIGFLTADRIALSAGLPRDAPARIRAGLAHALRERSLAGDTIVLAEELVTAASEALGLGPALVTSQVVPAQRDGAIEAQRFDEEEYLGLPRLLEAERRITEALRHLCAAPRQAPGEAALDAAITRALSGSTIELSDQQRAAVRLALSSPVSVITGGPGVGKTTVLDTVVAALAALGLEVALLAPTGRAAKRLEEATGQPATTIHRRLEFLPGSGRFRRGRQDPIEADFIICDESSMLDVRLAASLCEAAPTGSALCFVGDQDQLPSVGPGAVLRDLIESEVIPKVELTEVFRQAKSSRIVENAHRVQRGDMPISSPPKTDASPPAGEFFLIERADARATASTLLQLVADRIPRAYGLDPVRDIQVLSPMHRGASGTIELNKHLQAKLNPSSEQLQHEAGVFKVGDKVMQLQNDYDREVFNGAIGTVRSLDLERGSLTAVFEGREVSYKPRELKGLSLAYCCSIHKSQGSEFPAVIIPLLNEHHVMLKRNLLYTALTRARRLVVIVGQRKAVERAVHDDVMHQRSSTLSCLLTTNTDERFGSQERR
jgi:exodeoxyribonuclease V alpha subunit